jgi:hypothetical protein
MKEMKDIERNVLADLYFNMQSGAFFRKFALIQMRIKEHVKVKCKVVPVLK